MPFAFNHRFAMPLLFAAAALLLAGCLVASNTQQTHTGVDVPEKTFAQIETGKTTIGWVQATLGEPTKRTSVDQHTQVWKYAYTERTDSTGAVFLIFGGHSSTESTRTAYVEFKDDVVVNKWRE